MVKLQAKMYYPLTFINLFLFNIKSLIIEGIQYAINYGNLYVEQTRGIITLLPQIIINT